MHQFSKWAAMGILGFSALAPTIAKADTFVGDRTDFRDETIYFAMTTRFYDGDPKNNVCTWDKQEQQIASKDPGWRGDFAGLIEKLDYIKALGFTAIWITPVVQNASGIDYHGYHAMDFSSVDLRYESRTEWGSQKDVKFQDLIDAAHAKGMKIILDIVLQHTGNFGEDKFARLFERDQDIKNQANIEACLIPDQEKLGGQAYWDLPNDGNKTQYSERFKYMKNTDGQNHDSNNYWHHVGAGWNWDEKNRWWGQIAGDCVDLNTENPAVVDYLVECYGKFIEMGVDGFRIDTTGHIAPLTFNAAFIPKFVELGEKYKSKRLNQAPFYMFGECCARYGSVIYRDQHVLSSHYYTWKSDPSLVSEWKQYGAEWWAKQNLPEGSAAVGNMLTCEKDPGTVHNSDNVFMKNGAWHEPDYSQASGFNVIDFPMHYNYNDAGSAVRIANEGDKYYNDASWNVVYVDSHDYSPQPNDGIRFAGGTSQWAENLSMMFTFRGIPCIYYGSEVEFQKGKVIDDGMNTKLSETGRAYYGHYLEGNVTASDFAKFTASGQVEKTLKGDLAHHIQQLNKIRAAVPALRKGQYTFDGCSANGGWAFKRAYKDSYALVAVNGGATFSGVPAGTYTDIVTGQTYQGGGSITVSAPQGQGQLRVLVKGWTGGKVVEDGKFIYSSSSVSHGGNPTATDPGTSFFYTKEDAPGPSIVAMNFSPNGGTFRTETQTVNVTLAGGAVAGYFEVPGQQRVNMVQGDTKTFTIGQGMNFDETITVTWSATGEDNTTKTGSVTYKKVDPNKAITVYVKAASAPNLYAWTPTDEKKLNGEWPGTKMTETTEINGVTFYCKTFDVDNFNIILNNGNNGSGNQTPDIIGITEDVYYEYDGKETATKLNMDNPNPPVPPTQDPSVTFSPNGGSFKTETLSVTATAKNATSAWYKIGNGAEQSFTGTANFTIGGDMNFGESVTVTWSATNSDNTTKTGSVTFNKVEPASGISVFVKASAAPYLYAWQESPKIEFNGAWPGKQMTETQVVDGDTFYVMSFETESLNIIFNNGKGGQTANIEGITNDVYYTYDGNTGYTELEVNNPPTPVASVTFSPNGGSFSEETLSVTATAKNAVSAWYKIGNGAQQSFTGTANFTIGGDMNYGDSVTVSWGATGNDNVEKTGSVTFTKTSNGDIPVDGFIVYYDNTTTNWSTVKIHYWGAEESSWPGVDMQPTNENGIFSYVLPEGTTGVVFNGGNGDQTDDIIPIKNHVYKGLGNKTSQDLGEHSGVESVEAVENDEVKIFNLQGVRVNNPGPGIYIVVRGKKVSKIRIN